MHPPHEPAHGVRDFMLHLFTITIGLLIALSLEGLVERHHHRELVREAEASLSEEITANDKGIQDAIADVQKEQDALKHDVVMLKMFEQGKEPPKGSSMEITFHIRSFDNVAWKTAESTGALSFMSYQQAETYAGIYTTQGELAAAEVQAARDAVISLAPFINGVDDDKDPTSGEAKAIQDKIEVLQGQLLIVTSLMKSLHAGQQQFLTGHAGKMP